VAGDFLGDLFVMEDAAVRSGLDGFGLGGGWGLTSVFLHQCRGVLGPL
jgi:hypothetical protein